MITELALKFGRAPELEPETVLTTPVTVFVGPNNSGKSKILAEINQYCRSGEKSVTDVILDGIKFHQFTLEEAQSHVEEIIFEPEPNSRLRPGYVMVGNAGNSTDANKEELISSFLHLNTSAQYFCSRYLFCQTLMLDGQSRIALAQTQSAGDLQKPPQSSFQILFRDDLKREEVRRIIYEAFSLYFVLDPTNLGHLRIRLSASKPENLILERGIHDEAVSFHSQAQLIDQASDGVKAFAGIITQVIAGDPRILLIDEPEAFLHPTLAYTLGKEVARASSGSEKRLFVSTHSPNFVMGCIEPVCSLGGNGFYWHHGL